MFDQHILELHFEIFDRLTVAVGAHHLKFGFRNGLAAGAGLGQDRRRQIDQLVDADLAELKSQILAVLLVVNKADASGESLCDVFTNVTFLRACELLQVLERNDLVIFRE